MGMGIANHVKEHSKLGLEHKLCQLGFPTAISQVNWPNPATVDWFDTVLDEAAMHPAYAVTFQDSGDTVAKANHGWTNNTEVAFPTIVTTTGISIHTKYFIVGATTNTFNLSLTSGGAAITLTNNGSGTIIAWPSRITMPANGWAKFSVQAWYGSGIGWLGPQAPGVIIDGMVVGASILKNGASTFYGHVDNMVQLIELAYTDQTVQATTMWLQVSAGDYFTAMFNNSSGFASNMIDLSPAPYCYFECEFSHNHP